MEFAWTHYYSVTKRFLLCTGQWPYQKRRTRLFRLTLMTVTVFSLIIPQMAKFVHCNGDSQCIMMTIPLYLLTVTIVVKLYTCQFNSSKIRELTDHLHRDWEQLETLEEYEIMKTYAANGKLICLLFSSYVLTVGILFISLSLTPCILDIVLPLNESRPLAMPYEAYYFVDETEYYSYIFFHALVGLEISLVALVAHDSLLLYYTEHVCGIFALAGFRFENLTSNKRVNVANNNFDDIYRQKLALSVHTHWRALRFAELLEDTFYISFGVQTLIVTILMSVTLLQIALTLGDFKELMKYISYVVGQLIHMFCYCLQGQKLIDHSSQMRDKIYNCAWYEIPVKSQRLLLHVMRKSLQPNFLTASKIYIFSLKNFTTVLQTSLSYFTVFASFQ